jgi:hypothetical protein
MRAVQSLFRQRRGGSNLNHGKPREAEEKIMKYVLIYAFFLTSVFHTSCGQKQTEPHKDNINYNIKDTVTSSSGRCWHSFTTGTTLSVIALRVAAEMSVS